MRVLLIDQYRDIGGAQTIFLQLAESLLAMGVDVQPMFPLGGTLEAEIGARFGDRVRCVGIPELELTSGRKTPADAVRLARHGLALLRLRPLLARFDYVYVNGPRLFPAFLLLSSLVPGRFIYHVHLDHSPIEKAVIAALVAHPRTHAVVAASEFVLRRLQRSLGRLADGPRVRVLENSLNRTLSSVEFVNRWSDAATLDIVTIGGLIPEKGTDIIVDLASANPQHRFHMIGDADPRRPSFAAALRARATSNVMFHGRVANVRAAIEGIGAQVHLMPSRREESFGLAAIEAMACSCFTVTSGRGGLADIACRTGAWTAPTSSAWQDAIDRIQRTPRDDMAAAAREQHRRTLDQYGYARFERDLAVLFA
jgi:glycosyltransferase involved in cell wall biosynthesis